MVVPWKQVLILVPFRSDSISLSLFSMFLKKDSLLDLCLWMRLWIKPSSISGLLKLILSLWFSSYSFNYDSSSDSIQTFFFCINLRELYSGSLWSSIVWRIWVCFFLITKSVSCCSIIQSWRWAKAWGWRFLHRKPQALILIALVVWSAW